MVLRWTPINNFMEWNDFEESLITDWNNDVNSAMFNSVMF